ncbi:DNA/RNA non-specific endonuclease [Myceligenerans pegani]|uniref:DNA/RNA non-specific endonuclease n=1 Tax=Myceligenerans pegani TaxID=2776917 RepID=A0ABR9N456_9MICO|nr:DNA/RNA non-specific endonuclease [Myceligenerans sp. TRM 65318]MBE1877956.1 DNA/RNA non-specific endonuclease [Myceligenerans sp. TRM 65318]MBE3020227.1 DNA/RNA non-specific endonuclease [Myceligenerans sp. TRM 65318]
MTGYDAEFIGPGGLAVPLPVPAQRTRRLDYTHFSVLLDPARRLASVTACTIDGGKLVDLPRTGSWRLDPRVPAREQAGKSLYENNPLDRGHLVRRLDPVWGDMASAEQANADTFTFTNAAPQVDAFNQSKELWNGLEDHVLEYANSHDHRIVVFTGPVLDEDDPVYRGVAIPRMFWKVVAWASAGDGPTGDEGDSRLYAAGFVLDQTPQLDDADLDAITAQALARDQVPPLGPFRTYQVPVVDVGSLTSIDLGPLLTADVLGMEPQPPSGNEPAEILIQRVPQARRWAELTVREQIRLRAGS